MAHADSDIVFALDEARRKQQPCNLFKIVRHYCKLITNRHLTEVQMEEEASILDFACYDPDLAYWIERAEHYIVHELEEYGSQSTFDILFSHLQLQQLICKVQSAIQESESEILGLETLTSLVENFRFEPGFIEREVKYKKGKEMFRSLLLEQPPFSIFLVCWLPGQIRELHHHGNALDVIKVFKGSLTHEFQDKLENSPPLESNSKNTFGPDSLISVEKDTYHRLGNLSDKTLITFTFRINLDSRVTDAEIISLDASSLPPAHPTVDPSEIVTICDHSLSDCRLSEKKKGNKNQ